MSKKFTICELCGEPYELYGRGCLAVCRPGSGDSSGGVKHDSNKRPMHLLPVDPINDIVDVLAYGATKYDAENWRNGLAWTRVLDAVERHIYKFKKGEDIDDESGLHHLAHAATSLLFLLEYTRTHREMDDRYATKQRLLGPK